MGDKPQEIGTTCSSLSTPVVFINNDDEYHGKESGRTGSGSGSVTESITESM